MRGSSLAAAVAGLALSLAACSADNLERAPAGPDSGPGGGCFTDQDCAFGQICAGGVCAGDAAPTPDPGGGEDPPTVVRRLQPPVGARRFVFVLDTDGGNLIRIDPETLAVKGLAVGVRPTQLRAVPGTDTAVVLDPAGEALVVVRSSPDFDEVIEVPLRAPYTDLSLSPGGEYAVAWFGPTAWEGGAAGVPPLEPEQIRAKAAIVDLASALLDDAPALVEVPVDQRVTEVFFRHGAGVETAALVVGRRQVSVLALAPLARGESTGIPPAVTFEGTAALQVATREVVATPDGAWILLRSTLTPELQAVEIDALQRHTLALPQAPTDLAMLADGTRAIAVLRGDEGADSQVAFIEVPGDLTAAAPAPALVEVEGVVGSVALPPAAGADRAVLWTTSTHREDLVTLDLAARSARVAPALLPQSPGAALLSPDGVTALFVARPSTNPDEADPVERAVDQSHGYTLVNLALEVATPQILEVAPGPFAFSGEGDHGAVVVPEHPGRHHLHLLDLRRLVLQTDVALPGEVTFLGALDGAGAAPDRFYATLAHPAGRITFVEAQSGEVRTITGFLLASTP